MAGGVGFQTNPATPARLICGRQNDGAASSVSSNCSLLTREFLVRFERGQLTEFGSRKLLAVLAVLGMETRFTEAGKSATLEELRRERGRTA